MMQYELSARARPYGCLAALFLVVLSAISVHKFLKGPDNQTESHYDDNHKDDAADDDDDKEDKEKYAQSNNAKQYGYDWSHHLPSHIQREQMKEQRRKEKVPLLALKSKLYDNITMLDPQGQILCKISRKKARWYIQKNLAEWKIDEANTIQLKFEPKARSAADHDYGKTTKKNVCVACGNAEKHQMRFYIVPHVYRNLFPKKYKTHMSHDVVLLCSDCHLICGQASNVRMNQLEEQFHPQKSYHVDHELYKMRSSAMALLNWRQQIPPSRLAYHESNVKLYFKMKMDKSGNASNDEPCLGPITKEQLQEVIHVDYRIQNPNYIPGPELVVNSLVNNHEAMADFIKGWRQFFLDTIHPRHLPKGWSVNYAITCDE
jgi:hypothetical protein